MNPFQVVKDFERALCEYTGAPYAVTTTSCTMALLLAVAWHLRNGVRGYAPARLRPTSAGGGREPGSPWVYERVTPEIEIPKRTYVGVPMSIIHAGGRPIFRDEDWHGQYQLRPLPIWDAARWFTAGMYECETLSHRGQMQCVSFHWNKTLGIQQGGAILHDDPEADRWLREARFDGRVEGVSPSDQLDLPGGFRMIGWHCYMAPETAAAGLVRLASLPRNNEPLPNDDYPDLSTMEIFK